MLPPELARYVDAKVMAGTFASATDVVREGLRLLQDQDRQRAARHQELRDMVQVGLDQARRGEFIAGDVVFEEIERELNEQERKHGKT